MLAAAGIVVTLIRTPISAPDFAVLRLSIPAVPARDRDDEGERVGLGDAARQLVGLDVEGVRDQVGAVEGQRGQGGGEDREREADGQRDRRASRQILAELHEATHRPATGPNSGPTTIAPTTRISRVEEDADRRDDPGQDHVEQEDAAQLHALVGPLVQLLPDHGVRGGAGRVLDRGVGEVGDRVDVAERDRPVLVQAELPQVGDDHARVLARDVAHHEVSVRPHGRVLDPDHVDRGRRPAQHRVDPIGPICGRDDAQMDHAGSLFQGLCKIGCSLEVVIPRCAVGSAICGFGIPDVALFSVRPRP